MENVCNAFLSFSLTIFNRAASGRCTLLTCHCQHGDAVSAHRFSGVRGGVGALCCMGYSRPSPSPLLSQAPATPVRALHQPCPKALVQSSQERDGFGLFFLPTPTLSIREMFQKLICQTEQKLPSNFHPNEFMASLYPFSLNASVALFFPFFIFWHRKTATLSPLEL